MPASVQRRRESRWRRYFRRCRITMLLAIFAVIGALLYLNLVGLPDFLQRPLLEKLRVRGLDLQLATLRWHFFRGLVAEQVTFGRAGEVGGPRFTAQEAELEFNYHALLRRHIEITGVGLRGGRLTLPVRDSPQSTVHSPDSGLRTQDSGRIGAGRVLAIEKIRAELRLLPGDVWALEDFHAGFAGVDFFLSGVITNASAVRDWPVFASDRSRPKPDIAAAAFQRRLQKFADTLERIRFSQPPAMRAWFSGDAQDPESFALRLSVTAPDADTPWGRFAEGTLSVRLRPAAPIGRPQVELQLQATRVQTPWAAAAHPRLELRMVASETDPNLVSALLNAGAAVVNTRWADMTNAQFTAEWTHSLTNTIPLSGSGELKSDAVGTRWAAAQTAALTFTLGTLATPPPADPALGIWQIIQPYALGWSLKASRFDTDKLGAEEIACSGWWTTPRLEVTNLLVRFPVGGLEARGGLDVESREAVFEMRSDFDVHQAAPLLTEKAARWLMKYSWASPPLLAGSGAVVLPAWTNREPDWRAEVAPTLRLAAVVTATNCAYLKIPADWVRTSVSYTNEVWWLPDLVAGRPEGKLELAHLANDRTREFWFGFRSAISPEAVRPLLSTNAQRGLDFFQFSAPPMVDGGVWGRWRDAVSVGFTGRVELVDFTFREQAMSRVVSDVRYTNRFLEFIEPRVSLKSKVQSPKSTVPSQNSGLIVGSGIAADFDAQRIYFTNILSTAEPLVIAHCIGPKTRAALEPYRFHEPPTVRVNGFAPLGRSREAELRFDVDGGPFTWRQFHIPRIAGGVHWWNDSLGLSNVQMQAYGGAGAGAASFDLSPGAGTPFAFALGVTNVDLRALLLDVAAGTNQLEGRLDGWLVVTNANSTNAFTWNGHGRAGLRDGLIWAIPVFGVLSKPLDTIMPGLGSARISEGSATFSITNGVVFSSDLEMRAPTTRLQYVGTADFAGQVKARVRAEPLRDTWVIGPLLRLALWPVTKVLEYKMTGTLADPQPEPLYIPKLIYKPLLHPFQTLEDFFTPEAVTTNALPQFQPPP